MKSIYLDYNATTPSDPEVVLALLPYLHDRFGNPSSGHAYGVEAKDAVEKARRQVARLLGCLPEEIIFTGGGTEANNQALIGTGFANRSKGRHIITSRVEHPAIDSTLRWLTGEGFTITRVRVDGSGQVDPDEVRKAITGDTVLITIMHANNEVGTIQPLAEIGDIVRKHGIPFHTDAAQSVGKIPTKVDELKVDLLSVAGHKLYAPKGVGALYVRHGFDVDRYLHGAGHERGRRAGTENVPYIAALGKAAELAAERMETERVRLAWLRERFHQLLNEATGGVVLNGHPVERLPNTLNVSFPEIDAADLLAAMPEIAASTGSACHDGRRELSTVFKAMGVSERQGLGAVRFSLGRWTTEREIEVAASIIGNNVQEQRGAWWSYTI